MSLIKQWVIGGVLASVAHKPPLLFVATDVVAVVLAVMVLVLVMLPAVT